METNLRLALLIDGDNAQAALLPQMLAEVRKHGTITIRRVYGDWSEPNMNSWKEILHVHALDAAQQFSYTKGKNATDIGLTIGAMDILYAASVDGFCIVSSDSDYTPLTIRIRQQNLFVLGIGKKITPPAFVDACDVFVYTENLQASDETKIEVPKPIIPVQKTTEAVGTNPVTNTQKVSKAIDNNVAVPEPLKKLFRDAFASVVQDNGWAELGAIGNFLQQVKPGFDSRTYGHKQLSQLIQAYPNFIEVRKSKTNGGTAAIHIRLKANSKAAK